MLCSAPRPSTLPAPGSHHIQSSPLSLNNKYWSKRMNSATWVVRASSNRRAFVSGVAVLYFLSAGAPTPPRLSRDLRWNDLPSLPFGRIYAPSICHCSPSPPVMLHDIVSPAFDEVNKPVDGAQRNSPLKVSPSHFGPNGAIV